VCADGKSWLTPELNALRLRVAYNLSDYQQALFLTPEGNPMKNFGLYLCKASMAFAGLKAKHTYQ